MTEILSDRLSSDIILHVKTLLHITDAEKDSLLEALLENAFTYAKSYTGVDIIPSSLLSRMVCEDYSRAHAVTKKTRASMSEEYINGYSSIVVALLNGMRKIKLL